MNTSTSTVSEGALASTNQDKPQSLDIICGSLAALALLVVVLLAFRPQLPATPADRITLLALAIGTAIAFWTPLARHFDRQPNAAVFMLAAAFFVIEGLARQAGPIEGFSLQFSLLPEDKFVISYATFAVVGGAILSSPAWWKTLGGWTRAIVGALVLLPILALGSFKFLSGYFPVGATEVVDPTVLVQVGLQAIEYLALALLCQAAVAISVVRQWVLRALPLALLLLWLRHQFSPIPVPVEEDE